MGDPDWLSLPTHDPAHPSTLALDEWVAGALSAARAAEVEAHCDGCARCRAHAEAARQGLAAVPGLDADAAFEAIWARAAAPEPVAAPVEAENSGFWAWLSRLSTPRRWVLAGVTAAASAVAMMVLRPAPPEPGVRMKGDLALELVRKTAGGAQPMVSGDVFAPDDEVRFVVSLPAEGDVRIIGVEADGTLYTAWPLPAHGADPRQAAGRSQALPGAVKLDGRPGAETLHLVLCPVGVEPVCTVSGPDAQPACPDGCRSTAFVVVKGPR